MPDASDINQQTLPDFNLLRKPISDLALSLSTLPGTIDKVKKSLTGIINIDTNKVVETITSKKSEQPTNLIKPAPVQPVVDGKVKIEATSDPVVPPQEEKSEQPVDSDSKNNKTSQTPTPVNPWTTLYSNTNNTTNNTVDGSETTNNTTNNTTLLSKLLGGVQNTVKNIESRRENKGETFLQSILNIGKEKISQAKSNIKTGWYAGRTGEETNNDGILASAGQWLGDAWKEQREMDTGAASMVDAFKALKSGNINDAIKSTVSVTQPAADNKEETFRSKYEDKIDISKLTEEQKKTREQLSNQANTRTTTDIINDPFSEKQKQAQQQLEQFDKDILGKSSSDITTASDNINDGAQRIKQATEPQFPVPNSPHAAEYIAKAGENINEGVSEIQKTSEKFLDHVKSINELNNLFQFPEQNKKQSTPTTSNITQPVDETTAAAVGQRDAKQYGPEKVEIVNFKELAEEISELMGGKFDALSKSGLSGNNAGDDDDDNDSGLLDLLGMGALGSGLGAGDKKNKNK